MLKVTEVVPFPWSNFYFLACTVLLARSAGQFRPALSGSTAALVVMFPVFVGKS